MQEHSALVSPAPAQGVATNVVVSECLLAVKKQRRTIPRRGLTPYYHEYISIGTAYSTCFTPPPPQGIVAWERRLTAFYIGLYTFIFSPGPLGRKRLNDLFAQSSALFCSFCGTRRSQLRKVCATVLPKKRWEKR